MREENGKIRFDLKDFFVWEKSCFISDLLIKEVSIKFAWKV